MSVLLVDLLTQSSDYAAEPVRGLKVFCCGVLLMWVFLKVEKTELIRVFLPLEFEPTIPGLDLLLLYQLSYEAWREQIV